MKIVQADAPDWAQARKAFTGLANVLGLTVVDKGSSLAEARKVSSVGAETESLSLLETGVLKVERRRGNSSVTITSDATADGAYGIFCELAPKLAAPVERYVQVLNRVDNADIDPVDVVTCVSYRYRDGNNYKQATKAYFCGPTSRDSVNAFLAMLESADGAPSMIPGQIGLEDLQGRFSSGGWDEDSDHPFHEVASIELMDFNEMSDNDAALVFELSFDEFVKTAFGTLGEAGGWDQAWHPDGMPVLAATAWPGND
ncbi:MAG: hypothetical protein K2W33_10635 [Burkholderiales bacterium]|nr:hypothetical protein [Burkholderiales bacterium]